jgi:hypothetical protein
MWKDKWFNNDGLTFITNMVDQEFMGDYIINEIDNGFWQGISFPEYIEEKELPCSSELFIETWSCRANKNKGWIYKQTNTKYLIYSNTVCILLIDYKKLKDLWFEIYPDPIKLKNDYTTMMKVNEKYCNNEYKWNFNRTTQKNHSEGYFIPIEWFYKNDLIIDAIN